MSNKLKKIQETKQKEIYENKQKEILNHQQNEDIIKSRIEIMKINNYYDFLDDEILNTTINQLNKLLALWNFDGKTITNSQKENGEHDGNNSQKTN